MKQIINYTLSLHYQISVSNIRIKYQYQTLIMTILSKGEIKKSLDAGSLKVTRIDCNGIHHPIDDVQLQPIGIDLTLANEFRRFNKITISSTKLFGLVFYTTVILFVFVTVHKHLYVDQVVNNIYIGAYVFIVLLCIMSIQQTRLKNYKPIVIDDELDYKQFTTYEKIGEYELFSIQSSETIIGIVQEHIEIPKNMCGILNGRSRFARMGLSIHITAMFANPNVKNRIVLEIQNLSPNTMYLKPNVKICQMSFINLKGEAEYNGKFQYQTL